MDVEAQNIAHHSSELPKSNREIEGNFVNSENTVSIVVECEEHSYDSSQEISNSVQAQLTGYENASFDITSEMDNEMNVNEDSIRPVPALAPQLLNTHPSDDNFESVDLSTHESSTESPVSESNRSSLPDGDRLALSVLHSYEPTLGSTLFSFFMTIVFVGVLWIVVFTIFGSKGHAIAGVFLGLFLVGLLLNTCFLRFYFRLKLFFGVQSFLRRQEDALHERQQEEEDRQRKASEPPPSYSSIVEAAPPPYSSVLKHPKDAIDMCSLCQSQPATLSGICETCCC